MTSLKTAGKEVQDCDDRLDSIGESIGEVQEITETVTEVAGNFESAMDDAPPPSEPKSKLRLDFEKGALKDFEETKIN